MCLTDIEKIKGVYFLNVRGTKSKNAIRKVPIHPTLYTAIDNYVKQNGIDKDAPIFKRVHNELFRKASFDMGKILGFTEKELLEKHICFYSGRHTFKRILKISHFEKIAVVGIHFQELFMGHPFREQQLKGKGKRKRKGKINEYQYGNLNTEIIGDTLLSQKGKEIFKALEHYYL